MLSKLKHIITSRANRPRTPIPVYHSIDNPSENPMISDNIHMISPDHFRDHLKQLKKRYQFVLVDELVERLERKKSIDKLCAITFDDGYRSVIEVAYPILKELKIPATLFVTSEMVENKTFWRDKVRYIVNNGIESDVLKFWEQREQPVSGIAASDFYLATKNPEIIKSTIVDKLLSEYFEVNNIALDQLTSDLYISKNELQDKYEYLSFGNHSYSHYVLSSLNSDEQMSEIQKGHRFLKDLGIEVSKVFSIPFGTLQTFNKATIEVLEELGYEGFVMCSSGPRANAQDLVQKHKQTPLVGLTRFLPLNTRSIFL